MMTLQRQKAEKEREQLLARKQARAEAEAANRMKDDSPHFPMNSAPLNAMIGWTQLLRTRKFDEAAARALETIDRIRSRWRN